MIKHTKSLFIVILFGLLLLAACPSPTSDDSGSEYATVDRNVVRNFGILDYATSVPFEALEDVLDDGGSGITTEELTGNCSETVDGNTLVKDYSATLSSCYIYGIYGDLLCTISGTAISTETYIDDTDTMTYIWENVADLTFGQTYFETVKVDSRLERIEDVNTGGYQLTGIGYMTFDNKTYHYQDLLDRYNHWFEDDFESDNTMEAAKSIELGTLQFRSFHSTSDDSFSDSDWLTFSVVSGSTYTIETGSMENGDNFYQNVDTALTLTDSNGITIEYNNDKSSDSFYSLIEWTADFTGEVYVLIEEFDDELGDYTVKVTAE